MEFQQQLKQYQENQENRGRLLISCPDQPGIIAAISEFLYKFNANIIDSNQHSTNPEGGTFFIRIEFECPDLVAKKEHLQSRFQSIADKFSMNWDLSLVHELKRTAIFVSKQLHCLRELLWEWQTGDMMTDIALVVSNHEDARTTVESLDIPFYYIPATKENREEAEKRQLQLLEEYQIDLIVLARYMQILTPDFVKAYEHRIINIHHSFLPAFVGAKPYERAYQRGGKINRRNLTLCNQ
ncbi:formyltetrahydrofolate deformylase [Salinibacillus kushneri]|uniref:Formyltetrahydrofolate deformylase n=1 Tax=Salinibacillus kushneri TaxID=237682 RepID=A0A1I0CLQ1_9BACI|nr:formyltetrahydrofolate deformylase [Salinibacillus kushneri]